MSIKKPAIPESWPPSPMLLQSMKDSLETVMGRRKNRLSLPAARNLTFSASPTQAQCEALRDYVNEIRTFLSELMENIQD